MANKRIGNDGGNCIIVDGVAYKKVTVPAQPTSGAIDSVPTIINISQYTFSWDDSNARFGLDHNIWTPCEMGIAFNLAVNHGVATLAGNGVYVAFYTAPSEGVFRYFGGIANFETVQIKINGVWVQHGAAPMDIQVDAHALRVSTGNVITLAPNTNRPGNQVQGYFLPNVYP
jgi:hypothetical protein